ncbi:hypothetical protein J2X03_003801 [Microbacterium trichothecenolyticum]|uniref:hypothetical protein n=1 Tax=Microbacterium trichothecenolyticum TaxID=69370 RepID=UPI0028665471|nr:hypothetical protein [Microbacterium trichothecenolyticum]MDR7113899.1 hypothetical protein [Microbacterium trichothecenolyticum]
MIESRMVERDKVITSKGGAFIDRPWSPALIMHPVTAMTMYVATERGLPMSDIDVQFEAVRRYIEREIHDAGARALRRLNRLCRHFEELHEPIDEGQGDE